MIAYKTNIPLRIVALVLLTAITYGCQTNTVDPEKNVIVDDLSLQNIKNQNKAVKSAISKLEVGKTTAAKLIIDRVLRANSNHNTAQLLKRQLTQSASKIFNTKRFTRYQVKQGESLGSIAQDWLENSIYFVSLAKHNKINNPAKIQPGLVLSIPVIKNSPLVKKERRRSRANINLLKKYSADKKYLKSLSRMSELFVVTNHHEELAELQKQTLNLLAVSRVSLSKRHLMINQIETIAAKNKRRFLAANFESFIQLQSHSVLIEEFSLLFEDKSYLQAADKLIAAKKMKAISAEETQLLIKEKQLVDHLHENAIILKKNQQLEDAAESWGKILAIQPNNQLAIKYYHRTNKLLERLKKLN